MPQDSVKKPVDSTWEVLALLRFMLALIVIAAHVQLVATAGRASTFITDFSPMAAVLAFLIVSGFSIGHSISRNREQFYRRRFLRIYPLYAIAIIVPLSLQASRGHLLPHVAHEGVMNLFFFQTFFSSPIGINAALWTLAIEAACYFAAPGMAKASTPQLLCVAGLSALGYMIYPHVHDTYYAFITHGHAFFVLSWAWLAGFIFHRHRHDAVAPIALTLAVFSIMSVNPAFTHKYYGLTLAASIGALTMCNKIDLHRHVRKAMSFAGDVSFPLYLFHFPIFFLCSGALHLHTDLPLIGLALAAAVVGVWVDAQLRRPAQVIFDGLNAAAVLAGRSVVTLVTASPAFSASSLEVADEPITLSQNADSTRLAA